jgi:transposase
VSNGSGISRGDRNRNARLGRLRELVPVSNAIVGIDLADKKQMVVVTDHDSKVLARRTFRCRAWDLGAALDWAGQQAASKGFGGATVSCEPTGHRWRVLGQLAADRGMPFVCVQPMLTSWARRSEDLTFDKTDPLTDHLGVFSQLAGRVLMGVATVAGHERRRGWPTRSGPAGGAALRVA